MVYKGSSKKYYDNQGLIMIKKLFSMFGLLIFYPNSYSDMSQIQHAHHAPVKNDSAKAVEKVQLDQNESKCQPRSKKKVYW